MTSGAFLTRLSLLSDMVTLLLDGVEYPGFKSFDEAVEYASLLIYDDFLPSFISAISEPDLEGRRYVISKPGDIFSLANLECVEVAYGF